LDDAIIASLPAPHALPRARWPTRVLIVGDDDQILFALKLLLKSEGIACGACCSAQEALRCGAAEFIQKPWRVNRGLRHTIRSHIRLADSQ
jgi:FixJ family two-component response regulator